MALLCAATIGRAAFGFLPDDWGKVIIATDATEAGKALTPATPEHPVYFRGSSLGNRLGSIGGDTEPTKKEMNRLVTKILARQGYLGAPPGGPEPSLYVVVQWGYMQRVEPWFVGYRAEDDIANDADGGMGLFFRNFRSRAIETLLDNLQDANYGIIITAFDYKTARTSRPQIYWQTRITLPANGKFMSEALPTMLIAAEKEIGRPHDKPVFRDADEARGGVVRLGELQFLDNPLEPRPAK